MLKKSIIVFALIYVCIFSVYAQEPVAHKPAELKKIIAESKITYTREEMYIDMPEKDYSKILNGMNVYHEDSDGHMIVKNTLLPKEANSEWDEAEHAYTVDSNFKEARKHYKNVLDIAPDYYPAKVAMARMYEKEGDYEKAESSYKQAISKNYIDYLPHWLLAQAYYKEKKYDDAINEITTASVLNRNDSRILETLIEIYVSAHLKWDDWYFTPQYTNFKSQKENEIKVNSKPDWAGYAMGKAIWAYEPGYAEKQGEKPNTPSLIQEKECVLNLLANLQDSTEKDRERSIINLQKAQEFKLIDGYIYYEILLRQQPSLVYKLPNNVIKSIRKYVILGHGGEAPPKKK